jgi:hypothetical protein
MRRFTFNGLVRMAVLAQLTYVPMLVLADDAGNASHIRFQTSDRCIACHNGMRTSSGEEFSIGIDWRASIMANSSRDPYWQASVRREITDHPTARAHIEDGCADCHMPMARTEAKLRGEPGAVFAHLPVNPEKREDLEAQDGVSCSLCHQISPEKLGTPESFSGGFVIAQPDPAGVHSEFGPFEIDHGRMRIMQSSTGGFRPTQAEHIRQSELCASCHTLITTAVGPDGKPIGTFPEQVPYQEWLHSDYRNQQSCQSCHMPQVHEQSPIVRVLGVNRSGAARHEFVAANFFMQRLLARYHDELGVSAQALELTVAADRTVQFLQDQAARVSIGPVQMSSGHLETSVSVENLGGHKLPTAYPSRRAWLHFVVRDRNGNSVFESGAMNPDGSIKGNDNDADAARFEPHYTEIRRPDQVQIYESILRDSAGAVTTGLISTVGYLKDNRLLPRGFDKITAGADIAVVGEAAQDSAFDARGHRVRYSVEIGSAQEPFQIEAELWYQPIGFRWASNLKRYDASEPRRFNGYYDSMSAATAVVLARACAPNPCPAASHLALQR